jgi:hypothetical protein
MTAARALAIASTRVLEIAGELEDTRERALLKSLAGWLLDKSGEVGGEGFARDIAAAHLDGIRVGMELAAKMIEKGYPAAAFGIRAAAMMRAL